MVAINFRAVGDHREARSHGWRDERDRARNLGERCGAAKIVARAFFGQARYREPSPWARVALVSANDGVRMSVEAGVANNLKKKFREVRGGFVRAIDLIWWWINYSDPVCPKV